MSKSDLQKQADRADNLADQTVDEAMKKILRDAAHHYREEAKEEPFEPSDKWKLPNEIS